MPAVNYIPLYITLTISVVFALVFVVAFLQGREITFLPLKIGNKPEKDQSNFRVSLAYPRLLSKRYTSSFLVHIYLPEVRGKVARKLENEFGKEKSVEHIYDSELTIGSVVKIRLYCPEIEFSDTVTKKLSSKLNAASFVGKPKDNCHPGLHQAMVSICDEETNVEYQSANFSIKVVDFAFDHVSRPFLSNVATVVLGIGSLSMFILTLLGQIDTTFGLTSGTTAGALATAVYFRFVSLYQRPIIGHQQ